MHCRDTALPSICRYFELRRWVTERSRPIHMLGLPLWLHPQTSCKQDRDIRYDSYPKGREDVIGETRADDTAPAGDDSSDVVRECPLDGVIAEGNGAEGTSRESPL